MAGGAPSLAFQDFCQGLILDDNLLKQYMKLFLRELKRGLGNTSSMLSCFVTHVQELPTGNERGSFLALDVSGVLVRVLLITLKKMSFDLRAKQYNVATDIMMGTGDQLFDFLAQCIFDFTKSNKVHKRGLPLGFSFGFPCDHQGIKSGVLKQWTKGFNCSGVVGEDVVALLEFSISKIPDLNVDVCALISDTTGTMLSCAWKVRQCKIGVVLDAGTNICYVEKVQNVSKFRGDPSKPYIVINTEYGDMGADGKMDFLRTGWDKELDDATLNPGSHVCEKMISSLYLGELVRRVLITGVERGLIFRGKMSQKLSLVGAFDTTHLVDISKDVQNRATRTILTELGYPLPWAQDCSDLQYVCQVVWKRAADLASASIACLINYLNYSEITVAIDGAFYRAHVEFADYLNLRIRNFVKSDVQYRCVLADDGCGLGAALAAAATRITETDTDTDILPERRPTAHIMPDRKSFRSSNADHLPAQDFRQDTSPPNRKRTSVYRSSRFDKDYPESRPRNARVSEDRRWSRAQPDDQPRRSRDRKSRASEEYERRVSHRGPNNAPEDHKEGYRGRSKEKRGSGENRGRDQGNKTYRDDRREHERRYDAEGGEVSGARGSRRRSRDPESKEKAESSRSRRNR